MKISIDFKWSDWQKRIAAGLRRFSIIRAGRRVGKTYLAISLMLKFAIQHPKTLSWFVALDISTCMELAIPEFLRLCPSELIKSYNKTTRTIELYNGSVICFKTMETADKLRGRGLDLVILEEAAFAKDLKLIWEDVISAQLMGRGGRAIFISSPNGSSYFRRIEQQATEDIALNGDVSEWSVQTGNIYDSATITPEEIARKKRLTNDITWQQEFMGEYVDSVGTVYWDLDEVKHVVHVKPKEPLMYHIRGLDWGQYHDDAGCVWMSPLQNKKLYIYEEHASTGLDVQSQAKIIHGMTHNPIKWSVLDSSSWNRDSSCTSVAKRFAAAGIAVVPGTKDLDGSISDVKMLLANGDILIDAKCTKILQAMRDWQYGQHEPDILAAMRYGIDSLIRKGALVPPVKVNKPWTPQQMLKDEQELARRTAKLRKNLGRKTDLTFRIINQ